MEVRWAGKTKRVNGDDEDCDSNRMKMRENRRGIGFANPVGYSTY